MALLSSHMRIKLLGLWWFQSRQGRKEATAMTGVWLGRGALTPPALPTALQPRDLGDVLPISCWFNSYFQAMVCGKEFL